jgi:hypothetical protein
MTFRMRDGRRVSGELRRPRTHVGLRARTPPSCAASCRACPYAPARYDELVAAVAALDRAPSVDALLR